LGNSVVNITRDVVMWVMVAHVEHDERVFCGSFGV